jgi:hypothetical protein
MEIKLKEEIISSALEGAFGRAIDNLMYSREVHAAIVEAVSGSIASHAIGQAVENAVKSIDKASITQAIALEMQRCIVVGVSKVVEDAVVEIIAKMRGAYTADEKQRIRAELQAKGGMK